MVFFAYASQPAACQSGRSCPLDITLSRAHISHNITLG